MIKEQKFCIIEERKGPLTLTLKGDVEIMMGSDFKVMDPKSKKVIEHFKLLIDDGKPRIHKFEKPLKSFDKMAFVWSIAICSANPNNFRGEVKLQFAQAGIPIRVTHPLEYKIQNIPPCKTGNKEFLKGSLFFYFKETEQINPFSGLPQL